MPVANQEKLEYKLTTYYEKNEYKKITTKKCSLFAMQIMDTRQAGSDKTAHTKKNVTNSMSYLRYF